MGPNSDTKTQPVTLQAEKCAKPYHWRISWVKVFQVSLLHILALYALYLLITDKVKPPTLIFTLLIEITGALGITAGAHRLWTHRCYKAKTPLRIFLMLLNCLSFQGDIYKWSRDHRVHHKFTDTDADPHNINRGFFFAHMGWLLVRKHPDVVAKGSSVDLSDILADPVVQFQKRYYFPLAIFISFFLPTIVSVWFFEENVWCSFLVAGVFRYCTSLHATWLVNSAAHMYGYRPYDHRISPRENIFVSLAAQGEGFHNYHHCFPWDYSTSEFGTKWNLTTAFINLMAKIGQAYDLKAATPNMIKKLRQRTENLTGEY